MRNATRIGRLGGLAVGLGIGAAVAATSGTAAAAPVSGSDVDAAVAATSGAVAADSVSALDADPSSVSDASDWNLAISIDGIQLFHVGNATATSGFGDLAIAYGDGSSSSATGGFMDFALAGGSDNTASAQGNLEAADAIGNNNQVSSDGTGGVTFVDGDNDTAKTDNFMNFASVFGNNSEADSLGNCATAYVFGDGSTATAGADVGDHIDWAVALGNGFTVDASGGWLVDNIDGIQFFGL